MTPKQQEALDAVVKYGSQVKAAKALGISRSALRHRLALAKSYQEADDGIKYAMSETGFSNMNSVHSGWIKTDDVSLYFKNSTTMLRLLEVNTHSMYRKDFFMR